MNASATSISTPQRSGPQKPSHFPGGTQQARILIVDDENGPRQALRMLLKEDFEVLLASGVAAALRILTTEDIDIIITDIRMPNQTGLDLLRNVKQLYPDIQVIILTGYGQLDTAMEAIEYGAFAYLEKPFDNDMMLAKINSCLEKQRRENERRALEYLAMEANRFETLGKLITGTMHDLGTPLSVLGTHIDLMIEDPLKPDSVKRLETMRSQVHHCNDLVRTVMNFLRHSTNERVPFNLNEVVELCLEVARPLLMEYRVAVMAELSTEIPLCEGDIILVRQAVLNLIYNACQAMESQTTPKQLRLQTYKEEGRICFSIQDSGPGIPEESRERIFETFYSTKGKGGTGLGLAVVKNVMHRHDGQIILERPDRGAKFTLQFPCG